MKTKEKAILAIAAFLSVGLVSMFHIGYGTAVIPLVYGTAFLLSRLNQTDDDFEMVKQFTLWYAIPVLLFTLLVNLAVD